MVHEPVQIKPTSRLQLECAHGSVDSSLTISLPAVRTLRLVPSLQWDTGGSETYRSVVSHYLRGADGVILCFDVTRKVKYPAGNLYPSVLTFCMSNTVQACHLGASKLAHIEVKVQSTRHPCQ